MQNARVVSRLATAVKALGGYAFLGILLEIVRRILEKYRAQRRMMSSFCSPSKVHHWFWGYLPSLRKNADRRLDWNLDMFSESSVDTVLLRGPSISGPRQGGDQVATQCPKNMRWVLKDNADNYIKSMKDRPFFLQQFIEFLGHGIFLIDHGPQAAIPRDGGRMWTHQRKLAATIFSQSKFQKLYQDVFQSHGNVLCQYLSEVPNQPVDIQDWFFKYTLDSFGVIALNTDLKTMSPDPDPFGAAFDGAHSLIFQTFFENVSLLTALGLLPPGLKYLGFALFKLRNKKYRIFKQHISVLRRRVKEIIAERRSSSDLATRTDLLALFLNSKDENGKLYLEPSKSHDVYLQDMILNFIIAGRDTTACTMSWTIYEMCRPENSAVLKTLVAEIDDVLKGQKPTYADVMQRMPYLRAVIYEVLRLHPIVPNIVLFAQQDDEWPDGSKVAAGTTIRLFVYGLCRSPQFYEEPEIFKPQRWIPFKAPSPFEFPVFKAGPRICLGMTMAIFEASLLTSMILQRFQVDMVPGQAPTYSQMVTMSIHNAASQKNELLVCFKERKHEDRKHAASVTDKVSNIEAAERLLALKKRPVPEAIQT